MQTFKDLLRLKNEDGLIEFDGELYEPVELAEMLGIQTGFDIVTDVDEESWFSRAINGEKIQ